MSDVQGSNISIFNSLYFDSVALNALLIDDHENQIALSYHSVDFYRLIVRIPAKEVTDLVAFSIKNADAVSSRNNS